MKTKFVKDPPRYPKVINGYEKEAKESFSKQMEEMLLDLSKKMVNIKERK